MASLDKSNVVNGNTISASDISALYDAFTGTTTYDNIEFTGTSSNANFLNLTSNGANNDYAVPFILSSSAYSRFLYDSNDKLLYNPSTNTLTSTNFVGTGSYITGSNVQGPVDLASNLDAFPSIDAAGAAGQISQPRPIAATVVFSGGSGSVDLQAIGIGSGATTLGSDIYVVGQALTDPTQIDTSATLEINYVPPTVFNVTCSNNAARGAILTGWTTA